MVETLALNVRVVDEIFEITNILVYLQHDKLEIAGKVTVVSELLNILTFGEEADNVTAVDVLTEPLEVYGVPQYVAGGQGYGGHGYGGHGYGGHGVGGHGLQG